MPKKSLKDQNLGYCQGRTPLLLQNVETNTTIAVDIWVKNLCSECNLENKITQTKHVLY